ncbi:8-amino-7-oxononanoate synthase [Sphingomonas metalli]|uniref:8-amino-7-oxononanoate synthase n=1 Tax=Sphingomonas metalli TaxID=1779358 RepID=A0A916SX15_9SPHN|nr:aminotransferase class I/II-fold pyridoxal phosphate-dependent enzyme [Sphingomonas metalli]GGB17588.1 8-amino-7-oxononanoate synthase [Sphingomonas metalli]
MTETGLQTETLPAAPAAAPTAGDLMAKFDPLIAERQKLIDSGVIDPFAIVMEEVRSPTEAVIDGRETILLGTYNYMGMTFDPDVIAAGRTALENFGSGTNGSRMLNGTFRDHIEAEEALRDFYGTTGAIVFSTGYMANLGMISTLAGKGDYVILDADSHASIYDGCKQGYAEIVRFRHNSVEDLDRRLGRLPKDAGKLVVLEGVYSMLGDVAPLKEMVAVAKKHGAMVLSDEAHSMGFYGPNGRGVYEAQGCEGEVDFIVGTFSKSVGTVGGFCVSNHPKFEAIRLACRPYIFTASLPPSVVATAAASIRKLKVAHEKRARLWDNARNLHGGLKALGFNIGTETCDSAIVAVILEDQTQAVAMWQALLLSGLYVNVARPPATPAGTFLLRCSICAEHTPAQIAAVLERFAAAGRATGVIA